MYNSEYLNFGVTGMGRLYKTINLNWKFCRGDCPDAWLKSYDDTGWKPVKLPHDWSVSEPFSQGHSSGGGYLPGGIGWYRGCFTLPEEVRGKKVFITFDGVYNNAKVWVNSYYMGKQPYGYTTFTYDISHAAKFGHDSNIVSVRVNHEETADSRWFTGSGIYRKVSVTAKEPVYIGQYGVCFRTPKSDEVSADIELDSTLFNATGKAVTAVVRHKLVNPGGSEAPVLECAVEISAGGTAKAENRGILTHPALWSCAEPNLYTLKTELLMNGEATDDEEQKVGIRSLRFDPDEGFFLNGRSTKFKGVCVHHDAGCLGAAVPRKVWLRRLRTLRDMGCNAIRMSHNPHMPELLDLCDEMGFMVIDEAFDEWEGPKNKWWQGHNVYPPKNFGYFEDFPEWHEKDLSLLVRRDRNHPSVMLWSLGNEIDYPNDPYCHPLFEAMTGNNDSGKPANEYQYNPGRPNAGRLVPLAAELKTIVKQWDTTRPVTAAIAYPELSNRTGFCNVFDVCGYNYKEQWYDADHAAYPNRVLLGSENSMGYPQWLAVRDKPFICGQFLWTGIDYLGEARIWPVHGSAAGLLTLAGYPKPMYYFRRALWSEKPVAHLVTVKKTPEDDLALKNVPSQFRRFVRHMAAARSWNYSSGDITEVILYTNCPETELFLNDISLGVYHPADDAEDGYITVTVPFTPGTLEVIGRAADGFEAKDTLVTAGVPAALSAVVYDGPIAADGVDIAQIEVSVLDCKGNLVSSASNLLHVELEGSIELLGIENGNLSDNTDYTVPHRRAHQGRALIYVRSNGEQGTSRVRVCSDEGIRSAEAEITQGDGSFVLTNHPHQ